MITKEQITQLANEALDSTDRFVVDITVSKSNVIFVYIDADTSVTIDHCVELSRFIESRLDREIEDYELSVSSAGIDYPLLVNRQFKKYVEKDLEILHNDGVKKIYKLLSYNEEKIEVQEAAIKMLGKLKKTKYGETVELYLKDIKEIKPYINF
ncbi:MAG: ribosome assembly cofactor RimP [Bacteroidales bacterium]|nr:ribosome assembly cofactor RimP [Bacteroidales bacterium]